MENTHSVVLLWLFFFAQNFLDFTFGQCGKTFLIKEINHHNPARVHWQPGGVSSRTTSNFAQAPQLGQKRQSLARLQPFSPWSGGARHGLEVGHQALGWNK